MVPCKTINGVDLLPRSQYPRRLWMMPLRASRQGVAFIDYFATTELSGITNGNAHWSIGTFLM